MVKHPAKLSLTLILLGLMAQPLMAQQSQSEPEADAKPSETLLPLEDLRTFTEIFDRIKKAYVEEVDDHTLFENAVRGMLSGLDPHSTYLEADAFDDLQSNTRGEFGGLGIEVEMNNGFVRVVAPIDDTPAIRAGIKAQDLIVKIDDKPVKGMTLQEAVEIMRGEPGTDIVLTIIREGESAPLEITVTRDIIKVTSVKHRWLEPGFGYIRITQFQTQTGQDLVKALEEFQQDETSLRGLVLDLRNNPGGVLTAAVEVSDAFLTEGLIVYTQGRIPAAETRYSASGNDPSQGVPLVVLINTGSASASEIVAGALQDHHRAVIIGTESFGKGSVQTVLPIDDNTAIKLTTALYFTPNGRSIQAQGIKPDIVVERAQYTALRDQPFTTEADLNNHLGNGNGGADNGTQQREENYVNQAELVSRDNQLYEALNLLKGIHVFGMGKAPKTNIASRDKK